jgi:hypothetical protein
VKLSLALHGALKLAEQHGEAYLIVPRKSYAITAKRPDPSRMIARITITAQGAEFEMTPVTTYRNVYTEMTDLALEILDGH